MQTNNGGVSSLIWSQVPVLRIEFDMDRKPPEYFAHLIHPTTGAEVHLVGTAHVSKRAADQTRELILRVKPDAVVLELDPWRLNALVVDAQRSHFGSGVIKRVATYSDAVKVIFSGQLPNVVGGLLYVVAGTVLGSTPGAEFLAAVDAAKEVGAEIVLGDVDQKVTFARMYSRVMDGRAAYERALAEERREEEMGPTDREDGNGPAALVRDAAATAAAAAQRVTSAGRRESAMRREVLEIMTEAGCDDVDGVFKALGRLVRIGGKPAAADLVKVRECGVKAMELVRSMECQDKDVMGDWVAKFDGGDYSASSPGSAPPRYASITQWAMEQSIKTDRDLVLAHSLQRREDAEKIVGVVGAGHLRGIRRLWEEVPSIESRRQYDTMLLKTPAECVERNSTGPLLTYAAALAAAAGSYHMFKKASAVTGAPAVAVQPMSPTPRGGALARGLGFAFGATVFLGSFGTAFVAHALVQLGVLARELDEVAARAEAEGLVPQRQSELRSKKWGQHGGWGGENLGMRQIVVKAVNAAVPYRAKPEKDRMLYRD